MTRAEKLRAFVRAIDTAVAYPNPLKDLHREKAEHLFKELVNERPRSA